MPCPYAHVLGIPGEGVHSTRVFGLALFDIVATVILAVLVAYVCRIAVWKSLLFWFVVGEILHYLFGTKTAFLTMIGATPSC